ncbi:hypothetical protein CFOL_v3_05184 [Cephalotus follicularis]|uniref:Uncharacterized protein n=1 Tax=Cephalotus follicularis TaxID=3775 RepID=A0A1Q3B0X7_CEPFO|nr:hypothetical protein CFOL_v3_05184 [Cephalotus follicularis]
MFDQRRIEDYVDEYFYKDAYMKAYRVGIDPVRGQDDWETSSLDPILSPLMKRQPGRAKMLRKKGADEPNPTKLKRKCKTISCSRCHQERHNVKICKSPIKNSKKNVSTINLSFLLVVMSLVIITLVICP